MTSRFKEIRSAYGFEDVAIVPGDVTINPDQTDIGMMIGGHHFEIPIVASAMDAVVSPEFAGLMGKMGGLGVMNLEGVYARYEDPWGVIAEIAETPSDRTTEILQKVYSSPIKDELVGKRVQEIKAAGVVCAVSITPQNTKKFAPVAVEAGADIIVVQSTVTTARHISKSYHGLVFAELMEEIDVPVIVGNTAVSYTHLTLPTNREV